MELVRFSVTDVKEIRGLILMVPLLTLLTVMNMPLSLQGNIIQTIRRPISFHPPHYMGSAAVLDCLFCLVEVDWRNRPHGGGSQMM